MTPSQALREVQRASADVRLSLARRLDLGVTDVSALDHIVSAAGPLGPAELGRRLGIRSASATALVDRLEEVGHVERTADPDDRRRLVLRPTRSAARDLQRAIAPMIAALDRVAQELTPEEEAVVVRYLGRAAAVMRDFAEG